MNKRQKAREVKGGGESRETCSESQLLVSVRSRALKTLTLTLTLTLALALTLTLALTFALTLSLTHVGAMIDEDRATLFESLP